MFDINVTVSETIPVKGICPLTDEIRTIDVTYRKCQPLGSNEAYAVVIGLDCADVHECTEDVCPIANSRTLW